MIFPYSKKNITRELNIVFENIKVNYYLYQKNPNQTLCKIYKLGYTNIKQYLNMMV